MIEALSAFLIEKFHLTPKHLVKAQETLSQRYRQGGRTNASLTERLAYALVRLPATYAATQAALKPWREIPTPSHLLDVGCGPGTATLVALQLWPSLKKVTLIDQDPDMLMLAQTLLSHFYPSLEVRSHQGSVAQTLPQGVYDLAVLSYVWTELSLSQQALCFQALWSLEIARLAFVLPGTSQAFQQAITLRDWILRAGGFLAAPCPHPLVCPLVGKKNTWCHFSTRLSRTSWHRQTKQASLPYEDEKFMYLLAQKEPLVQPSARVIKKPMNRKGHCILDLCCPDGSAHRQIISRKDRTLYDQSRSVEWGDPWPYPLNGSTRQP